MLFKFIICFIAGIGAGLSAYDLKTGKVIWTNTDWKQREGSTTTLTIAGDVLISGTQWGGLYGNDIRTGKQLWKLSDNGLGNRGASPVYKDGKLWIISSKSFLSPSAVSSFPRRMIIVLSSTRLIGP